MRKSLFAAWLALPIGMLAWHFGAGQDYLALDLVGRHVAAAQAAERADNWAQAVDDYGAALSQLPESAEDDRQRLALARAQARIRAGQMVEGQEELASLIAQLSPVGPSVLLTHSRNGLATASYFAAWLMRLEGAAADEWKPEAERARQQFRLLAEASADEGEANRLVFQKNLEATVRLEQMDLATLLARPLPKNCPPCKNLSQRKRKQCQSQCQSGQKEGKEKQPQDARQEIKQQQGAGLFDGSNKGS